MSDNVVLSPFRLEFSSQEEFEDFVMEIIMKRLGVQTSQYNLYGRKITDYYNKSVLVDKEDLK